jgi:hypothetical protein
MRNNYNKMIGFILLSLSPNVYAISLEDVDVAYSNVGFSDPKEIVNITSRVSGFLEKWEFEKGESVNKDDIIVIIEDDKTSPSIKAIQKQINAAEKDLVSKERLLNNNYVSEIDVLNAISELETLKDSLGRAIYLSNNKKIISDFNGVLRSKDINKGESVSPGTILGQIYDPYSVDVYSNVYNFDRICNDCKVLISYDDNDYGPYDISYKIKNLEVGFDVTKVGVFIDNSPIPYGVTLDFKLVN